MNREMRIADLARYTGVTTSALRYYEARGLLEVEARTPAGYRVFGRKALGRVGFIQRAKGLGMSLGEIERLLREPPGPSEQVRMRHAVAHKLAETENRIAELETLRVELSAMHERLGAEHGACGHLGDCECWLPNNQEVQLMTDPTQSCDCCGCSCPPDECGCCDCCGCGGK